MALENNQYFWKKEIKPNIIRVGLNKAGQEAFGDVNFVDVPTVNQTANLDETLIAVEAEKMVQDLDSPISGQIIDVNTKLSDEPQCLNDTDLEKTWIADIKID